MRVEYKFRGTTPINRRKDRRYETDLSASVDDVPVVLQDISLGGMSFIAEEFADFEEGEELLVVFDLPSGKQFAVKAVITRVDVGENYAAFFRHLSTNAFKHLEDYLTGTSRRKASRRPHNLKASSAGA